jgi:RNA polymerase sigma factor (sigma-70 family)
LSTATASPSPSRFDPDVPRRCSAHLPTFSLSQESRATKSAVLASYYHNMAISHDEREPVGRLYDPVAVLQDAYPRMMAMARNLANSSEAEDLVQESFVKVLARYPRFEGLENPRAYLMTVLARSCFRAHRRQELPSADVSDLLAVAPDAIDELAERRAVAACLSQLPLRQRTCVYLRFMVGLDDQQIGRLLDCRASTVRSQTSRGLRKLGPLFERGGMSGE